MLGILICLALATPPAGPSVRPAVIVPGGDAAPGLLVNVAPGVRPFDPPDPGRPTVVFVHGWNLAPRLVHFRMAEEFAAAVARRGGRPRNLLSWNWNAATFVGLDPRVNVESTIGQGDRLGLALLAAGLEPTTTHLIGHSSGGLVSASAARRLLAQTGRPIAQLTMIDPAAFQHPIIFERMAAGTLAPIVENYWVPGPGGYGRHNPSPGVRNYQLANPTPLRGSFDLGRSGHIEAFRWYLATAADPSIPHGYNLSVSARDD